MYLISRANWDFLLGPITASTAVNKVDAYFLHLLDENCALLNSPLLPLISDFLRTLSPVIRADSNKHWLGPGGSAAFDNSEREAKTIFE